MPRWIADSLLSMACFGAWGVTGKAVEDLDVSPAASQALSTIGILPIMAALAVRREFCAGARRLRGGWLALAAGVLVGLGNLAFYHALAAGDAASTAVALTALYPLATVLLALLLLRERPHGLQVAGIAGSLAALFLCHVSEPGGVVPLWMLYALASILLWGGAGLVQKLATNDTSAESAAFWFLAAFIPLAAGLLAADPPDWSLSLEQWLLVALLGATYGLGNLGLLAAFRHGGKASVVAPLTGLYPIIVIPLALVFFDEEISGRQWAGIAIALASAPALSCERGVREAPA
jgi:drug/metabolite transporter (DMT)-like permease